MVRFEQWISYYGIYHSATCATAITNYSDLNLKILNNKMKFKPVVARNIIACSQSWVAKPFGRTLISQLLVAKFPEDKKIERQD